ncbi:MAG: flagellar motor protein MotB [Lachnospiraceae bacterium]|nr:flagellar motor protein MotB [Lachnospiraceae bacterium]MBP5414935.1 flagellar motor protein MotB [Lachnospiraceae bacterium]
MAKRKEDPPPAGAPAWQSTFADLMNLLLCFFVLLFSMSNMDAEKFEALAASFSNTFSIFSGGGSSFDDGLLISNGMSQLNQLDNYITNVGAAANTETMDNEFKEEVDEEESLAAKMEEEGLKESEQMAERIEEALAEVGKEREVDVSFTSQYVLLTLKGSVLFDSGKADLKQEAMPTIAQIGVILERYGLFGIEIEGHTDNVPMNGGKYENNDVLSSYRALSLFNYLTQNTSIDPASIKHSGRGEYAPIADNSTPEGRSKNRRIEIKVYNSLNSLVR